MLAGWRSLRSVPGRSKSSHRVAMTSNAVDWNDGQRLGFGSSYFTPFGKSASFCMEMYSNV
eukprot:16432922-Heterocapsa_arctica.AAC.1